MRTRNGEQQPLKEETLANLDAVESYEKDETKRRRGRVKKPENRRIRCKRRTRKIERREGEEYKMLYNPVLLPLRKHQNCKMKQACVRSDKLLLTLLFATSLLPTGP